MNCGHAKAQLDDYVDGHLGPRERQALESHLESCSACRAALEETRQLIQVLRGLPVATPSAGFAAHALRRASRYPRRSLGGWGFAAGFGSAAAAGLALWVITTLWMGAPAHEPSARQARSIEDVELAPHKVHAVDLAFNSPANIHDVTFTLELPRGIQLQGHPGERIIVWHDALRKGRNLLRLRLVARNGLGGDLIARVQHRNEAKSFRVHLQVDTPRALGAPPRAQLG